MNALFNLLTYLLTLPKISDISESTHLKTELNPASMVTRPPHRPLWVNTGAANEVNVLCFSTNRYLQLLLDSVTPMEQNHN